MAPPAPPAVAPHPATAARRRPAGQRHRPKPPALRSATGGLQGHCGGWRRPMPEPRPSRPTARRG
ncbi:MAG: hypothetical protein DI532_20205 [Azospirillum brasilense]|nr:MAG: hypothetical protein DI532_20205 [Azospirillum brasilense]